MPTIQPSEYYDFGQWGSGHSDYHNETGKNEFEYYTTEKGSVAMERLPDLPGLVSGIVGVREGARGNVYTLQCANCSAVEEPARLVLMQTHFHSRSPVNDNPRLCRPCRVERYAGCDCHTCVEDRAELRKVVA